MVRLEYHVPGTPAAMLIARARDSTGLFGYVLCLAAMGCVAVGMIFFFKRKSWL